MRKLLLATVAVLGASIGLADTASAQTTSPAPGTITVRLNGTFRFYAYGAFDRDVTNTFVTANGAAVPANAGANKLESYGFAEYARLFPGFDGVSANGLQYGASLQIRQDQGSPAGGGVAGSISQQDRARAALYFRREWGYLGTDKLGTIRFGSTDGPSGLYETGTFENFATGGLNGDLPGFSSVGVTWPFHVVGNLYTTNKAIYLSPQLLGFDFGVAYEPSTANVSGGTNCNTSGPLGGTFFNAPGGSGAGAGCDRLSSSLTSGESGRRKNAVDAQLRYRGSFGGFGIVAAGGWIASGNVKDVSGTPFSNVPGSGGVPNYDGLSVGNIGVAATFGGLTVGGQYLKGRMNNQWGLVPKGLPDAEAFIAGASYTIGPVVVGAHYLNYVYSGNTTEAYFGRLRHDQGVAAGATYSLAPGVSLIAEYVFQERQQSGVNMVTGQAATTAAVTGVFAQSNRQKSNILSVGTVFSW